MKRFPNSSSVLFLVFFSFDLIYLKWLVDFTQIRYCFNSAGLITLEFLQYSFYPSVSMFTILLIVLFLILSHIGLVVLHYAL